MKHALVLSVVVILPEIVMSVAGRSDSGSDPEVRGSWLCHEWVAALQDECHPNPKGESGGRPFAD